MSEDKRTVRNEKNRDEEVRPLEKKTRRKKSDDVNEFHVEPSEIPDGFTVEWKRHTIYGKEDTPHLTGLEKDGWEPASPKDFPSLVGRNHKGSTIIIKDLILMIRPKELTQEAYQEDRIAAKQQVRTKLEEIGLSKSGEAPRVDSAGRTLAKVNISYDRIPVE